MANKKRLIDANSLVSWLIKAGQYLKGLENSKPITKAIGKIIDHVKAMPTVDAVEVVHACWEEWWPPKHMILTGDEMLYRCSACTAKYSDIEGYKYCPNCGAKMDGE